MLKIVQIYTKSNFSSDPQKIPDMKVSSEVKDLWPLKSEKHFPIVPRVTVESLVNIKFPFERK